MPLKTGKICCHEKSVTNTNLRNIPEEQRFKEMFFFLYEAVFLYIVSQDTPAHGMKKGTVHKCEPCKPASLM
jgi:hypothetical protein